jgi:hypothetical protein
MEPRPPPPPQVQNFALLNHISQKLLMKWNCLYNIRYVLRSVSSYVIEESIVTSDLLNFVFVYWDLPSHVLYVMECSFYKGCSMHAAVSNN